jgi:4-hydroxy-tetrahydrodipicolinate synthase
MQSIELIIQAEKSISHRRGFIATNVCRRPYRPLDEKEEAMITRFLQEFDNLL